MTVTLVQVLKKILKISSKIPIRSRSNSSGNTVEGVERYVVAHLTITVCYLLSGMELMLPSS
jgi:hypothetical protein